MSNPVLSVWEHKSATTSSAKIIPDGCRDLVYWISPGERPRWTITTLDDQPYNTQIETGAYLRGYRLHPGTLINTDDLLKSVHSLDCNAKGIDDRINSFCTISPAISEAMACIGTPNIKTIGHAAKTLGVTMRTLQRLLKLPTGRTPAGWLSLSRARRAARLAPVALNLAEIAYDCGYADQPHMTRELNRWFGTSPARISFDEAIMEQLGQPGYY